MGSDDSKISSQDKKAVKQICIHCSNQVKHVGYMARFGDVYRHKKDHVFGCKLRLHKGDVTMVSLKEENNLKNKEL